MRRFIPQRDVDIDEVLLDAVNVSALNQQRLEGKMELPLARRNVYFVAGVFGLIAIGFLYQLFTLQVVAGAEHRAVSENNSVREDVIIAERGVIFDRHGELVVWNEEDYGDLYDFPVRAYTDRLGMGQLLGYVSYPQKDRQGFYFRTEYVGRNGVESSYNEQLAGTNGQRLIEVDAHGDRLTEYAVESPQAGAPLTLSIDAELSEAMYQIIATSTAQSGSRSGAGAIMDITTGEIIALTSFPSYDPEVMADGDDRELIA